jgi:hypothetical protein
MIDPAGCRAWRGSRRPAASRRSAPRIPPQSPVAWSSFITGLDPGGHGIFDFIHRDPKTMLPYLSTSKTEGGRAIGVGRWQLPLSSGKVELLRAGPAVLGGLESRGVPTTIIRMPANFPPSGTATRELSGMGTPDLLGTYGTFAFYTSEPFAFAGQALSGGVVHQVRPRDGRRARRARGTGQPLPERAEKVRAAFTAHLDHGQSPSRSSPGSEERLLASASGATGCRSASRWRPRNRSPARCASTSRRSIRSSSSTRVPSTSIRWRPPCRSRHPDDFAAELARATGRFYTQGMPEDTTG